MESTTPPFQADPYEISTRAAWSTGTLTVRASIDEVVRAVEELSKTLRQPRLVSLSAAGAEFKRSINFRTWGMRITLRFRSQGADQTLIFAESGPRLPTTIMDWGQGASDLRTLLGGIDRQIASGEPGPHAR
jgi:hypothetical protein